LNGTIEWLGEIANMRRGLVFGGAHLAAFVIGVAITSPASAEMQVIESNAPAYKVGVTVPNTAVFNLNAGERVQVLILPSKQTRVFEGKGAHSLPEPRGGSRSATPKKKPQPE
jgi:hypothetical protein